MSLGFIADLMPFGHNPLRTSDLHRIHEAQSFSAVRWAAE
jgi:hypothetical protein